MQAMLRKRSFAGFEHVQPSKVRSQGFTAQARLHVLEKGPLAATEDAVAEEEDRAQCNRPKYLGSLDGTKSRIIDDRGLGWGHKIARQRLEGKNIDGVMPPE